jgi:putative flavoprotein involved in K+ transport
MSRARVETIVIGGGQAGLAVGYHLHQRRLPFVIVDENARVGDSWRTRWDTLRLFTPARLSALPGIAFPGPSSAFPTKDQTADYLEAYARELALPIQTGVKVERLTRNGADFEVTCTDRVLSAKNVVVATGGYQRPRIPEFAADLDEGILQLHSSSYRNRAQLRDGGVLVVGAGNSGAEIATEVASHHRTWLSGRDTGHEPARPGSFADHFFTPLMWLVATRFTLATPMGRKLRDHFLDPPRGIPLARVRKKDILAAGVERVGRTTGVHQGFPRLEDGRVLEVSNVIWCTGYTPDFSWIDIPLVMRHGFPAQRRGVVESVPGLYFVGLLFLYSISSALVGGVGRDAEYIVEHVSSARRSHESR